MRRTASGMAMAGEKGAAGASGEAAPPLRSTSKAGFVEAARGAKPDSLLSGAAGGGASEASALAGTADAAAFKGGNVEPLDGITGSVAAAGKLPVDGDADPLEEG